ncbi:RimJ/RimL family protein N-acetyltransferase [Nocardia tenerifensis]|uniref:RimJ/RimL family protein N-acetyltransferase n=1 Tax=Nocardia tenerifensis TaxID=228006 RepID=A0A318K9I9_9NOCA|nr:GNAT family N-acetyltransferase [Nocardia tenerifensis]PXX70988.1 RimJ/RimL family protein N-acetyltransferase [Nocardia tenerifensis]
MNARSFRLTSAKATFQRWPRQSALGLATTIALLAVPAGFVGFVVTAESQSAAPGFIVDLWLLLVVTTILIASWLWVWRVSRSAEQETTDDVLPDVETPRLILRRPKPNDAISFAATIDEVMLANNGWTTQYARALIKAVGRGHPTLGLLVFESRSDATVIGGATVHPIPGTTSSCSLGWWIGPHHRGAGYASEAVTALIDAIHDAGYLRVAIGTDESNRAVQRICDKIGATVVDRRPQPLPNGSTVPGIWYEHQRVASKST